MDQIKAARVVADELQANGHEDISDLDLLDVLASYGLVFEKAPKGKNPASDSYLELLTIHNTQ